MPRIDTRETLAGMVFRRYIARSMRRPAESRPLISRLRDARRVAAFMLVALLGGTVSSVACASHDLADAGILGPAQLSTTDVADHAHTGAPGPSGGAGTSAQVDHCCHGAGHHWAAVLVAHEFHFSSAGYATDWPPSKARATRVIHPELRPPIL